MRSWQGSLFLVSLGSANSAPAVENAAPEAMGLEPFDWVGFVSLLTELVVGTLVCLIFRHKTNKCCWLPCTANTRTGVAFHVCKSSAAPTPKLLFPTSRAATSWM